MTELQARVKTALSFTAIDVASVRETLEQANYDYGKSGTLSAIVMTAVLALKQIEENLEREEIEITKAGSQQEVA